MVLEGFVTLGIATGFAHALQSGAAYREARAAGTAPVWLRLARAAGLAGPPVLILWLAVRLPVASAGLWLLGAGLWVAFARWVLPAPDSPIYRQSFREPPGPAAPQQPPEPRVPPPAMAEEPPDSAPLCQPDPRSMRLHCRSCGNPVSKPIRENPETISSPRSPGYYAWQYRPGCEVSWQGHQCSDPEVGVLIIKRQDVGGSVRPLEHHPDRVGCCGFPGGYEPNIKCHGCGNWVLVDIEDCQAPRLTAARTSEVELRPVS